MNKQELITALSKKSEITKKDAERHIQNLFDIIMDAVASNNPVKAIGFGIFEKEKVKGRSGIMHFGEKKGQEWKSEDSWKPVFSPGKLFVDKVKGV
jgi:DNA-binding protein HU-beta